MISNLGVNKYRVIMKRLLSLALILALVVACADDEGRRTEDFNFGWRFSLGDFASWSEPSYDDGAWRELHLPHDWSIEGEWMAGVFVWTGFDYLGEPTAFSWPSRSSYFGICDLAGFPKDPYYMYQSEWTQETMLHLLPHWNWKEGDKIDVWAYYNGADTVELFLNGRSLGQSAKNQDRLHAFWPEVPFEAGRLEAVSYKEGKKVSCCSRETTGTAARLKLTADREKISADGYDLSFICVEALDDHGRVVPDAELELDFSVEGAGELFGVDNGNAADTLSLKGTHKRMFSGKALAVVRSIKGERGSAVLRVSSPIGDAEINIKTK